MKKQRFIPAIYPFVCALFLSSCAGVQKTAKAASPRSLTIDESRYSYVNWQVRHEKKIVSVIDVYDGDTIAAGDEPGDDPEDDSSLDREVIRFLAVNTPEIAHPEQGYHTDEPGAAAATEFTKKAVLGKKVIFVIDPDNRYGVFGRTLALIFYNDDRGDMRCLNWELLKRAHAKENLWAADMLCNKAEWRNMAKLSQLMTPAAFIGMGRQSLKEKFVYDALEFYKRGVQKFPSHADLRKDLASLYSSLERVEKNQSKKKEYRSGALFHWNKLKGTKHDALAKRQIRRMAESQ